MNNKCLLITILCLLLSVPSWAYDFSQTIGGRTFYFTIDSHSQEPSVIVTFPGTIREPYAEVQRPSGYVDIPATVPYDGETYRVVAIGSQSFSYCSDITGVTIPLYVRTIAPAAFRDCSSLRHIRFAAENCTSMTNAFMGCSAVDTITIGESVHSLPSFAFYTIASFSVVNFNAVEVAEMKNAFFMCRHQAKLNIGPLVKRIPDNLCCNFLGLSEIDWGGVEEIGVSAFDHCVALAEIVLPASLKSLGANAFANCKPGVIRFKATNPPKMTASPFSGVDAKTGAFIPCGSRTAYVNSPIGRAFESLVYADTCLELGVVQEVVYLHDTVYRYDTMLIRDTMWISLEEDEEEVDTAETHGEIALVIVDGKNVTVSGVSDIDVAVFDTKGRIVHSGYVVASETGDGYQMRLSRKGTYYLRLGAGVPVKFQLQ